MGFGVGLRNILYPKLFIADSTGLTLAVNIDNAAPLDFSAALKVPVIGAISLAVRDGSGRLDLNARLGLDKSISGDGRHAIDPLAIGAGLAALPLTSSIGGS